MSNRNYLRCAETAKLLRLALKESFPKVKFSVKSRTYAGGASIDVKWMDGPMARTVEPILSMFKGAYFDGMIDYQGSRYFTLDGEPVTFASNFVFGDRTLSKERADAIAAKVAELYGRSDWAEVTGSEAWGYRVMQAASGPRVTAAIEQADKELGAPEALPSATLARVKFEGDDGYGQGTVGMPGDKVTGKGYPGAARDFDEERAGIAEEAHAAREDAAVVDKVVGAFQKGCLVLITGGVQ